MVRFSERLGIVPLNKVLQVDSMSGALRNSLWNLLFELYDETKSDYWGRVAERIALYFRKVPVDGLPVRDLDLKDWVKKYFYELLWYGVYDLIEFLVHNHREMTTISYGPGFPASYHKVSPDEFVAAVNKILERELSGFRFIEGLLVPITEPVEINEIEAAAAAAATLGLHGAREHIRTSIELLGKKPEPDYRNAVKEAISAVESVVKQISGADSSTLDAALKELASKTDIHPALRSAFSKLYGYTSDESGVRHAILDQPSLTFAEAKYMIVSCSAFVHYLIEKAQRAGLLSSL